MSTLPTFQWRLPIIHILGNGIGRGFMKDCFIVGRFWVKSQGKNFLGEGRVELLRRIKLFGSISKAAKDMKMSYKAAWDSVDKMNTLAATPLVESLTGGSHGGGTSLTCAGLEVIDIYDKLMENFDTFVHGVGDDLICDITCTMGNCNRVKVELKSVENSGNTARCTLSVTEGIDIITSIPLNRFKKLNSNRLYATIYPTDIILLNGNGFNTACNAFTGTVTGISQNVVEIGVKPDFLLVANYNGKDELKIGEQVTALFSEYAVKLMSK
jgi:molybdate transport system regulatory protein